MDNFEELMEEQNEIETNVGERDFSQYIGAGVIALAGATIYEGGRQFGKRVVKPAWGRFQKWNAKRKEGKNPQPEEVETVPESEEK